MLYSMYIEKLIECDIEMMYTIHHQFFFIRKHTTYYTPSTKYKTRSRYVNVHIQHICYICAIRHNVDLYFHIPEKL